MRGCEAGVGGAEDENGFCWCGHDGGGIEEWGGGTGGREDQLNDSNIIGRGDEK